MSQTNTETKSRWLDQPLPERIDTERLVLGAALTDPKTWPQIIDLLSEDHFCLEKHRRIFRASAAVHENGQELSTVSLANELIRRNHLESVDGLHYLSCLTDCFPHLLNLAGYCEIVRAVSIKRQAIKAMESMIQRCFDPGEDAGDLLADVERVTELLNTGDRKKPIARTTEQVVEDAGGLNVFLSPEKTPGIPIPFADIDDTLSGLRKSKFILLGARPAIGKSALASQIAEYAAAIGKTVLFVTLEMSAEDIIKRAITGQAGVSSYKFRRGTLAEAERFRLLNQLSQRIDLGDRLLHVDKSDITVQGITNLLRSLQAKGKTVDLCIVDYLQLLSSVGRFDTRVQEVSSISRGLKKITQHFRIPVLALSQLTRKEDHRKNDMPELDWLKESGQLEQDADQVIFLWAKKDPEQGDTQREIHWRVAKNRDGILNRGILNFETTFCRFNEDVQERKGAA